MSTDQGWEKWYWRDWFSDPDVQCLSACGRCGWFELLGWMWLNETDRWEGQKRILKRLLKMDEKEFKMFLEDVFSSDVCTAMHNDENGTVTLVSRRRERENEKNERTRENNRIRQERHRQKQRGNGAITQESLINNGIESESESDKSICAKSRKTSHRFEEFWGVYPRTENKKRALDAWKRHKLDAIADTIIAAVEDRVANDPKWERGESDFIPHPTTYLNGERWNDEYKPKHDGGHAFV